LASPRSEFPELELDLSNLQALCRDCNVGKPASDTTDWRDNVMDHRGLYGMD
jgi:hypothetical protein